MVTNYKMVRIHCLLKHLVIVPKVYIFFLLNLLLSAEFMLASFIILMV